MSSNTPETPTDLRNSPRSWQEDFYHENGSYLNTCYACDQQFMGHKRRIGCKLCTVPVAPDATTSDDGGDLVERYRRACEQRNEALTEITLLRVKLHNIALQADLWRDEFLRIKALSPGSEIEGLCDRAVSNITQRFDLIQQRDKAEKERDALASQLAQAQGELTKLRDESAELRRILDDFAKPTGCRLIASERQRQITEKGWTPEHDDTHTSGDLTDAALCYAAVASAEVRGSSVDEWPASMLNGFNDSLIQWPWEEESWKPSDDPVRNLVKAGALIVAEIERLTRKGSAAKLAPQEGAQA